MATWEKALFRTFLSQAGTTVYEAGSLLSPIVPGKACYVRLAREESGSVLVCLNAEEAEELAVAAMAAAVAIGKKPGEEGTG